MNLGTGNSCPRKKLFCSLTGSVNGIEDKFLNLTVQTETLELVWMGAAYNCRLLELRRKFKSLFDSSVDGNFSRVSAGWVRDWLVSPRLIWFETALHLFCPTFCSHAHFCKICTYYIYLRVATLIFAVIFFTALHILVFFLFPTPGPITRRRTQEQPVWARLIICAREHGRLIMSRSASRFTEGPAKGVQSLHLQQRMDEEVSCELMLASINCQCGSYWRFFWTISQNKVHHRHQTCLFFHHFFNTVSLRPKPEEMAGFCLSGMPSLFSFPAVFRSFPDLLPDIWWGFMAQSAQRAGEVSWGIYARGWKQSTV